MERLLDETALFLHRVEANLPERKQRVLRRLAKSDPQLASWNAMAAEFGAQVSAEGSSLPASVVHVDLKMVL